MINITSYPYISGYTFRTLAKMGIPDKNDTSFMKQVSTGIETQKVEDGDILYVTGVECKNFFQNIAPKIKCNFSVVSAMWDEGANQYFEDLLPENLKTWWTINKHIQHAKVKSIPLGLQNLHWRWDNNIQSSPATYKKFKNQEKSKLIIASFSVDNNRAERSTCVEKAKAIGADFRMFEKHHRQNEKYVLDYFNQVSQYKFVLCPWGAGIDTHRMWETLYLGSIPITRKHTVYKDFLDYPIIFLDDWNDLLKLDFDKVYEEYKTKLKKENRIYFEFWKNQIQGE